MNSNKQDLLDGALGAGAEQAAWRTFWITHIRIGFAIFLAETVVVAGYLALTPEGPHRSILWPVAVLWLLLALVGMSLAPIVASKPWCATYSVTWTALSAFGVAIVAILDSGMNSPLLVLPFLPLIFGTLMFTPRAAGICGLAAMASLTLVALADRDVASSPGRAFDLVSRIGGDEFALLLPDTDVPSAVKVAERIRHDLPAAVEVPVTLSIGVGGLDRSMPTSEHLFDDADFALYQVKRAGRDAIAIHHPGPSPISG